MYSGNTVFDNLRDAYCHRIQIMTAQLFKAIKSMNGEINAFKNSPGFVDYAIWKDKELQDFGNLFDNSAIVTMLYDEMAVRLADIYRLLADPDSTSLEQLSAINSGLEATLREFYLSPSAPAVESMVSNMRGTQRMKDFFAAYDEARFHEKASGMIWMSGGSHQDPDVLKRRNVLYKNLSRQGASLLPVQLGFLNLEERIGTIKYLIDGYMGKQDAGTISNLILSTPEQDAEGFLKAIGESNGQFFKDLDFKMHLKGNHDLHKALSQLFFKAYKSPGGGGLAKFMTDRETADEKYTVPWMDPGFFTRNIKNFIDYDVSWNDSGKVVVEYKYDTGLLKKIVIGNMAPYAVSGLTGPAVKLVLDPFQLIRIQFRYPEEYVDKAEGEEYYVPAISLFDFEAKQNRQRLKELVDFGLLAVSLVSGIGGLGAASRFWKVVEVLDMIAAVGDLIINDQRYYISQNGGRDFLKLWDLFSTAMGLFGIGQMVVGGIGLIADLVSRFKAFRGQVRALKHMDRLNDQMETLMMIKNQIGDNPGYAKIMKIIEEAGGKGDEVNLRQLFKEQNISDEVLEAFEKDLGVLLNRIDEFKTNLKDVYPEAKEYNKVRRLMQGAMGFESSIHPNARGMLVRHHDIISKYAKEKGLFIIIRNSDEELKRVSEIMLYHQRRAKYLPKPERIKAKTLAKKDLDILNNPDNLGLVAFNPPDFPGHRGKATQSILDHMTWEEFSDEMQNLHSPEGLEKMLKEMKDNKEYDKLYNYFKEGLKDDGFFVSDAANDYVVKFRDKKDGVLYEGLYSDYDMHGVYTKDGLAVAEEDIRDVMAGELNDRMEIPMIQHPAQDTWKKGRGTILDIEKDGCTAYLPNGKAYHLKNREEVTAFYEYYLGIDLEDVYHGSKDLNMHGGGYIVRENEFE